MFSKQFILDGSYLINFESDIQELDADCNESIKSVTLHCYAKVAF